MVQITKANFLGHLSGNQQFSGVTPGTASVQNANDVAQAADRATGILENIKNVSEDMEMQSALTSAQLEFSKKFEERANVQFLEDGSPAHKTLDADAQRFGQETLNTFSKTVSGSRSKDKFNLMFNDFVSKKRIQGLGIARDQAIGIAYGNFSSALNNLSEQASNQNNLDNLPSFIKQANNLIDDAVKGNLINPGQGVTAKKIYSEGVHNSVWHQKILHDPTSSLAELSSVTPKEAGVSREMYTALIARSTAAVNTEKTQFNDLNTQIVAATTAKITDDVNQTIVAIQSGPESDNPNSKWTDSTINAKIGQLADTAQIHSDDDIANETKVWKKRKMLAANSKSGLVASNQSKRLLDAYKAHNKGVQEYQTAKNNIITDGLTGRQPNEDDVNIVHHRDVPTDMPMMTTSQDESGAVVLDGSVVRAARYNVPVQEEADKMTSVAFNAAGLAQGTKQDQQTLRTAISAWGAARANGWRVFDKIDIKASSIMNKLTRDVNLGFDPQRTAENLQRLRDLAPEEVTTLRTNYNKKPTNGTSPLSKDLDKVLGIGLFGRSSDDVDPILREQAKQMLLDVYSTNGEDRKNAVETVEQMLSTVAGENPIPGRDGKTKYMFNPLQKALGVTTQKSLDTLPGFARQRLKRFLDVNDIPFESLWMEPTSQSNVSGQATSYLFGGTSRNGTSITVGTWTPKSVMKPSLGAQDAKKTRNEPQVGTQIGARTPSNSDAVASDDKTIGAQTLRDYQKDVAVEENLIRARSIARGKAIMAIPSIMSKAPIEVIKDMVGGRGPEPLIPRGDTGKYFTEVEKQQAITRKLMKKLSDRGVKLSAKEITAGIDSTKETPDQRSSRKNFETLGRVTQDLENWANEQRNDVNNWVAQGADAMMQLGVWPLSVVHGWLATDAEGADIEAPENPTEADYVQAYVAKSVMDATNNPMEYRGQLADEIASFNDVDNTEAEPDDVFDVSALDPQALDTQNALTEQGLDPITIAADSAAIVGIERDIERGAELTPEAEDYYNRTIWANEKWHGPGVDAARRPVPMEMSKDDVGFIKSIPGGWEVYDKEGFVPYRYLDSVGKPTVGIGWNIDESRDKENQELVDILNDIYGGNYSLENLRHGQRLEPRHAVVAFEHHLKAAEKEVTSVLGQSVFDGLGKNQKAVAKSMMFQLGIGRPESGKRGTKTHKPAKGFKAFTSFIKNSKSGNDAEAAFEIINSTAFNKQTPYRFISNWKNWIMSSDSMEPEDVTKAANRAQKHSDKHKHNWSKAVQDRVNKIIGEVRSRGIR